MDHLRNAILIKKFLDITDVKIDRARTTHRLVLLSNFHANLFTLYTIELTLFDEQINKRSDKLRGALFAKGKRKKTARRSRKRVHCGRITAHTEGRILKRYSRHKETGRFLKRVLRRTKNGKELGDMIVRGVIRLSPGNFRLDVHLSELLRNLRMHL